MKIERDQIISQMRLNYKLQGRKETQNLMRSIWERQKITKRIKIGWRRSKKSQGGSGEMEEKEEINNVWLKPLKKQNNKSII